MNKINFSEYILQHPVFYWGYQKLVGGVRARKLFIENNVKPKCHEKILDIGCGPGNILDFLPEMNYHGFDVDENYISSAKHNYGKRGHFTCNNMDDYKVLEPNTFDKVIAIGVTHHLSDDEAIKLFKIAKTALKSEGHLYTFDGCYTKNQNIIAYYFLKSDRGKYVRTQSQYEKLASSYFPNIKSIIDKSYFHIPYTSLIMDCKSQHL